jgi:malate permease and related proteins
MISLFSIFNEFFVLFIIAIIGFGAKRFGIFNKKVDYAFTQLILFITLPLLIIYSLDYKISLYIFKDFLWLLLLSVFILSVAIILAHFLVKPTKLTGSRKGIFQALIIFGNQGFIGFALCYLLFQEQGIAYATIFNIFYLIMIWTYGVYLVSRHKVKLPYWKLFINPGVIATIIGLILLTTPLTLPDTISKSFQLIGLCTIPLSMIFIGSLLGNIKKDDLYCYLRYYPLWLVALFKLLILPLLLFPFLLLHISFEAIMVAIILTATPSAPTIALYAKSFKGDFRLAAVGVFLTTILACLTIPILFWLASYLFCLF